MSGEALKWALDQEGSGPAMQALLLVLGLSATSPSQLCELSRADLARRTRQSQRNVTRLLAELEELGVVERDDRYSGDGGREIIARLRIDRTVRLPTREERASMPASHEGENEDFDNPEDSPAGESGRDNMSRPRSGQEPHQVGTNSTSGRDKNFPPPLYTNLEESLSSASASAREGERETSTKFQKRLREDWKRFAANYPGVMAMDLARGEQELGRLNLGDRDVAIREAAHYAAEVKAAKKTFPKEAWRWIADRDFDRLAEARQAKAEAAGLKAPLVPVRKGTPGGDAWEAARRAQGSPPPIWTWSERYGCDVFYAPTMFPPGATRASAAAAPKPADTPKPAGPRVLSEETRRMLGLALMTDASPAAASPSPATGPPEEEIEF